MKTLTVLGIAPSTALRFVVAADAETVRFTVENRIRRGRVEWRLVDPTGRQRLSIHGTRGRVSGHAGALQAIAGTWTARARFARATAEYAVAWTVRP